MFCQRPGQRLRGLILNLVTWMWHDAVDNHDSDVLIQLLASCRRR